MSMTAPAAVGADLSDRIYVNGINIETGNYAVPPLSLADVVNGIHKRPGGRDISALHGDREITFARGFGTDFGKLDQAGWGVVFHEDTPADIRNALEPLLRTRRAQAGERFKELDYKKGEQTRNWYVRHGISAGGVDPEIVPYYLLLVGPPTIVPFEFQYLVGIEYAVGRLAFETAEEYERYARSIVAYEQAGSIPNANKIAYWGTRHLGDPATELSASLLIDPLANGLPEAAGALKRPLNADVGCDQTLLAGDDATKANLLSVLHGAKPPAVLFTASHGMAIPAARPNQTALQGALLCQDWEGFGSVKPEHFLAATDVPDDANVNGLVAFMFACFGAGTPDADQFLMDLSLADQAPRLAPQPFTAALPRRLLTHPNGSALAVIGHIDRAWGFSIRGPRSTGPQIVPFRNGLGFILSGTPIGRVLSLQFGERYAALSTALLTATAPTVTAAMRPSDRDLVTYWIERNDAQNYVVLGDPAVRIRTDAFS
jgi:hypothetical protein